MKNKISLFLWEIIIQKSWNCCWNGGIFLFVYASIFSLCQGDLRSYVSQGATQLVINYVSAAISIYLAVNFGSTSYNMVIYGLDQIGLWQIIEFKLHIDWIN